MIKNKFNKSYYFLFLISFIYLIFNLNNDSGYWFDEWSTLFCSDPSAPIQIIYDRINGIEGVGENTPKIYFLILRFFFKIFGYSAENGRVFSIIFFISLIYSFYLLLRLFFKKEESILISGILSLNPLLLWMANETRVDTFNIFFCTLNIYFFFKSILKKSLKYNSLYIISGVLMLSIYPLTISILFSEIIYYFFFEKKRNFFFLFFTIITLYILINYNYIIKNITGLISPQHAKLQLNFFFTYFFNTYFGNKYFGGFYLSTLAILFFLNIKKNFNQKLIIFSVIAITLAYLMIITAYFFSINIATPRYIDFIVPIIVLVIIYNVINAAKKLQKKYTDLTKLCIYIFVILNIFITNNNKPVKKPPINSALELIKSNDLKNIYIVPDPYFSTYINSVNFFKVNKFILIDDQIIKEKKLYSFAFLCLNNPRFAVNKKELIDDINCQREFDNFKIFKSIYITDFKIILYKSNN